jgi:hypothetical protein
MTRRVGVVVLGAWVLSASSVQAEDNAQFRTAVSVTGGLSVGSEDGPGGDILGRFGFGRDGSDAGLAVGGGIARDLNPRLTLEANGAYFDRGSGGWSADAGFRLNLVPASRKLVPYFAVSGGVIGGDTRRNERDMFGPMLRAFLDSPRVQPLRGVPQTGRGRGVNVMPAVTTVMQQLDDFRSSGSYTDGMLTMGGGVRFDAGAHVFVRPDVRAQLVFSNDTRVLGLFTLNFGYRF